MAGAGSSGHAAMQPLFLRPGVYLATVRDDLVSLDLAAGEYACLTAIGREVAPPASDGRFEVTTADVADLLLEAGLAARRASGEPRAGLPPPATVSCWRAERALVTGADQRRFARAYMSAAPRFWRASFGALVASAQRGRGRAQRDVVTPASLRDAQVFDQLAPFGPFAGECLFRAFLLLAYLRRGGRDATWVFGVRTYPFQAHCWLQVGDMVLNDAVERVCGYTPILAV